MAETIKIAVSIQKTLSDQLESLAQQFNISRSHLVGMAIENFLENYHSQALWVKINQHAEDQPIQNVGARSPCRDAKTPPRVGKERMVVNQGDIFWVPLEALDGAETNYTHPHVVIQDNVLNHSRINTVVVCALTTNFKRAKAPGNVFLEEGEANLPKQSVVVVSQVSTVDKTQLGEYIGSLTEQRINQILAGMQFLQVMTEHHEIGAKK